MCRQHFPSTAGTQLPAESESPSTGTGEGLPDQKFRLRPYTPRLSALAGHLSQRLSPLTTTPSCLTLGPLHSLKGGAESREGEAGLNYRTRAITWHLDPFPLLFAWTT